MSEAGLDDLSLESLVALVVDEVRERHRRGEQPDIEQYAARYPQHAAALREVLAALRLVELSLAGIQPSELPAEERLPAGSLGDFRLIREVGRGGMGVVYEAEQLSLRRPVALKVLPFAATMDPRQLQRFHNEAQAAACLHHQHIVPVYGVGCERGVHFYAMQFIDGQTLADLIRDLRHQAGRGAADPDGTGPYTPAPGQAAPACATPYPATGTTQRSASSLEFFRMAARLCVQAAQALEHAHQMGVLHRDIKPANLLVDGRGNLWVTDFGLAHVQSDTRLTRTGDLVGTLRYMSPEQVLGKRPVIDHRSDVYSLGATLYELLTLEPAFPATDRQELLRQIAFDEPRPPRQLNRAIPVELETIVLKALAKNPDERYAAAQELADDLERFLEDRPIRARRPTWWQQVRKWTRRHRAIVTTTTVSTVLALVATAVVLGVSYHRLRLQEERTQANLEIAEESFQRAIVLADRVLDVAEKELASLPHLERLRDRLATTALRQLEEFADDDRPAPAVRFRAGMACRRIGHLHHVLRQHRKAEPAFDRGIALLGPLAGESQAARHRRELALAHLGRANLVWDLGRRKQAEADNRRALELLSALHDEDADSREYRADLAWAHRQQGLLLAERGRHTEAENAYRESLQLLAGLKEECPDNPDYRRDRVKTWNNLSTLYRELGRLDEAEKAHGEIDRMLEEVPRDAQAGPDHAEMLLVAQMNRATFLWSTGRTAAARDIFARAIARGTELAARFKHLPVFRRFLAITWSNQGLLLSQAGAGKEAKESLSQARNLFEGLVADYPEVPIYKNELAGSLNNVAMLVKEWKEPKEAARLLERAIALEKEALKSDPGNRHYRNWLVSHQGNLATVLQRLDVPPGELDAAYRQVLAAARQLVSDYPEVAEYRSGLASQLNNWAGVLRKRGEKEQARKLIEEAIPHQQAALKGNPNHPRYLQALRNHYDLLGLVRDSLLEKEAEALMRQVIAVNRKLSEQYPRVPFYHHELGGYENDLAEMLSLRGWHDEALRLMQDAIAQQKAALAIHDAPKYRDFLARHYFRLAGVLERGRRLPQAKQARRDGIAEMQKLVKQAPNHAPYQHGLAEHHHQLGMMLLRLGEHAPAEAEFAQALGAWRGLVRNFPQVTNFQADLANALNSRGILLKETGRLAEAMKLYDEAVPLLERLVKDKPGIRGYRRLLARCLDNSALVLRRQGQVEKGIALHQRAVDLLRVLCREAPKDRDYRHTLAIHLLNLGSAHYQLGKERGPGRRPEAEKADREALALLKELAGLEPSNAEYRADQALVESNLGGTLTVAGDYPQAEKHLRAALKLYDELVREHPGVPDHKHNRGRTLNGLGILLKRMGRPKEAEPLYRDAVQLYEELVAGHPQSVEFRAGLARSQYDLADFLMQTRRQAEAEQPWRQACRRYGELLAGQGDSTEHRRKLAASHWQLANVLAASRPEEAGQEAARAVPHYERLVKEFPREPGYLDGLARCWLLLGELHGKAGRPAEAEKAYGVALDRIEQMVRDHKVVPAMTDALSRGYDSLALLLERARKAAPLEQLLRRAVASFDRLATAYPGVRDYRTELAGWRHRLGSLCRDTGRLGEAEKEYRAAVALAEKLVAEDGKSPALRYNLAVTRGFLGGVLRATGRPGEARELYSACVPLLEKLIAEHEKVSSCPDLPDYHSALAATLNDWANLLTDRKEAREARRMLERAISHQEKAVKAQPGNLRNRVYLRSHYSALVDVFDRMPQPDQAEKALRGKIAVLEGMARDFKLTLHARGELARSWLDLAHRLGKAKRGDEAEEAYRKSVRLYTALVAEDGSNAEMHSWLGGALNDLAGLLRQRGELDEARKLLGRALEQQRLALKAQPKHPRYRRFLLNHHVALANVAFHTKDHEQAAKAAELTAQALPDDWRAPYRAAELLQACQSLAARDTRLEEQERRKRAGVHRERRWALVVEAARRGPDEPAACNLLAWFLATVPNAKYRDPKRAVELARQAVEKVPQSSDYQETLGVALCRAGDHKAALVPLLKAVELSKGGDCSTWLYLALAHRHQGNHAEAYKWHRRAVTWLAANRENGPKAYVEEISRLNDEVAALLQKGPSPK